MSRKNKERKPFVSPLAPVVEYTRGGKRRLIEPETKASKTSEIDAKAKGKDK